MSNLRYLSIICLAGQLMVSSCKQKDVIPSIDALVGQYDCRFVWYGGYSTESSPKTKFQISKSTKGTNMIEVRFELDTTWSETWQLKYENGKLYMEKQIIRDIPSGLPYPTYGLQEGAGRAFGDSLTFEGERFIQPNIIFGRTFCKYWAKKKR